MAKVIFVLLFSLNALAVEKWMHRAHEKMGGEFTYSNLCKEMSFEDIKNTFDLKKIEGYQGIEVDAYYNSKVDKLLAFHKSKKYPYGSINYQCFSSNYVTIKNLIEYIKGAKPEFGIWIDTKNDSLFEVYQSSRKMANLALRENIFIEVQNIWAIPFYSLRGFKVSLWLKSKSIIYKEMAKLLGAQRFSMSCGDLKANTTLTEKDEVMCWGKNPPINKKLKVQLN